MNPPVITCSGVTKSFGKTEVLKGIDLEIPHGSIVGLLGTNGSGKSTLIKCLLGLLKISAGAATVCGEDPWDLSAATKHQLGYVPQVIKLYPWMRVNQVIDYTGAFYDKWDAEHCKSLMELWELDGSKWIKTLSGGQLQRLAIILALGHKPSLLILDEPAASLDPVGRRSFLKSLLNRNAEGGQITGTDCVKQGEILRSRLGGNQRTLDAALVAWHSKLETIKSQPAGWLRDIRLDWMGESTVRFVLWTGLLVGATVVTFFASLFSDRGREFATIYVCVGVGVALIIPLASSLSRRDILPLELLFSNSRAQFMRRRTLSIAAKYAYLFAGLFVQVAIVQYFCFHTLNPESPVRAAIVIAPITMAGTGLVLWGSSIRNIFALGLLVVVGLVILTFASFSFLDFRWIEHGESGEQIHAFVTSPLFYALSYLVAGLLLWTGYHRLSRCELARE